MGLVGLFSWLSERIDHYKFLMETTSDENEKKAYAKIIADLEAKQKEIAE